MKAIGTLHRAHMQKRKQSYVNSTWHMQHTFPILHLSPKEVLAAALANGDRKLPIADLIAF
jgi:hypothetical protein